MMAAFRVPVAVSHQSVMKPMRSKSRDGGFVKAYGGKGVTMGLKEAARFSAKTLESLSLPSADVEKLVARVCEMSGLTLSEKRGRWLILKTLRLLKRQPNATLWA